MAKGSNKAKADYMTDELFALIIDWIEQGHSIRKYDFAAIGKSPRAFYYWMDSQATPEQLQQYARAMERRQDVMFEGCLDISDTASPEEVQKARLMIDTRKWMLGKMNPKKYSDKLTVAGDADNPIAMTGQLITKIEVVHVNPSLGDAS